MSHADAVDFRDAQRRMLTRVATSRAVLSEGLPHWARTSTGEWTTTPDGDWTGGAYAGQLWLAQLTPDSTITRDDAAAAVRLMRPRVDAKTAFKGFGFYLATAVPSIVFDDAEMREVALRAARSLADMFDERLGLIPLGSQAEEASDVGDSESSIDSLQATALLFWAADESGDGRLDEVATQHLRRVLEIHVRADASVVQSSTLDPESGAVQRTHTHKGYSDTSTWGRAQGWAMLYSAHAAVVRPDEPAWGEYAKRTIDWWIAHVPDDLVSYWDFDDPSIPDTSRDTAATAMAAASALRLAHALGDDGARYRDFAERTTAALVNRFLTPVDSADTRPEGMLTGGCFTRKSTVRAQDAAEDAELIFGSYFLFEALAVLTGDLAAGRI